MALVFAYLASAAAFALIETAWLSLTSRHYRSAIGEVLSGKVAFAPALAFYVLYVLGIVVLAVAPVAREGTWVNAAFLGGTLGLVASAAYALTNQATLKAWSTRLSVIDMAYGALATAASAVPGFWAARWTLEVLR